MHEVGVRSQLYFVLLFIHREKKEHNIDVINDFGVPMKRPRMTPPLNERVMLYVRQDNDDVYTPLHVVPPTQIGLLNAVSQS